MKNPIKIFCALLVVTGCLCTADAQTKTNKSTVKSDEINRLVTEKNFVFNATYVTPLRGGGRALTSEYDLTVSKDAITAYLPYFGQAYLANYGSTDNGIKFTWTNFNYKETPDKKGNREILIIPKDKSASDANGVQALRLYISADGYASLQITNMNRDPISFTGTIEPKKPKSI
jgi:hypothetical protein